MCQVKEELVTFFMQQLADSLGQPVDELEIPEIAVRPSTPVGRGTGTDRQVELRSLAEQLVCEANAVIQDRSALLTLTDEVGQNELAFTIASGDHTARVSTSYEGSETRGQIISADLPTTEVYELAGPDALPDLIIRLCLVAGLHNEHSAHLI